MNILVCVFHQTVLYRLRTLKVCDMCHMGPFSDTFVDFLLKQKTNVDAGHYPLPLYGQA